MGYPQRITQTLYDAVTPVAVTSSTDATPIVITATAHGMVTGQRVFIFGHATNIAANGIFLVGVTTTNTFQLLDEITGASVAGSGAGAGSGGICLKAPPVMRVGDFKSIDFFLSTAGGATVTLVAIGSLGKQANGAAAGPRYGYPNMGATQSPANPWSYLNIIDLNNGASITGTAGIVVAGTDVINQYEVNINLTEFLTVIPISWSAGAISVKAVSKTNQ